MRTTDATAGLLAGIQKRTELDAAWATPGHGARVRAVRTATERLRERFAGGPRVVSVRTLPLSEVPYPTKYAFNGFAYSPVPILTMTHRCVLVQFQQQGALKNLLFNPSDIVGARATPFFARLARRIPASLEPYLVKRYDSLESQLHALGVPPEDIHYIAFDHFHTQDVRSLMGTDDDQRKPLFPNAVLLAPKNEWNEWDELHPMQRDWFVRDGKRGVRTDRVALIEGDLQLGDGVLLLRTPGHTIGNQTLFFNTPQGVWGISENGTCADNWSPLESQIPGLASHCRTSELDVVLNANTPEIAVDQYASMILERTLVDPVRRAPGFVQMFPSSEVTPSALAPGLTPTLLHHAITAGEVVRTARVAAAAE